jgi:hypothetical protein
LDPCDLNVLGDLIDLASDEIKTHSLDDHQLDFVERNSSDLVDCLETDLSVIFWKSKDQLGESCNFDLVFKDLKFSFKYWLGD